MPDRNRPTPAGEPGESVEERRTRLRAALDAAILGQEPSLDAQTVADSAGVSLDEARRLWRALGFPDQLEEQAFTTDDIGALHRAAAAHAAGLDLDTLMRLTRAVGSTMSRLADWEVGTLLSAFDAEDRDGETVAARLENAVSVVEAIAPSFELLMLYAWRRHLAAAVARADAFHVTDEDDHDTVTVGFADLVQFTALSNELDDQQIGDLVEVFETRCHDVITERGGRIIKSLGDSVLYVAETAPAATEIDLDIIGVVGGDKRLPDVRVGLATGPVVLRMGDVFGPSVNLAARLTAVARRNRLIVDRRTAELLPAGDFEWRSLVARPLRGFGDVEPVTVRRTRPRHLH